MSTKTRSLRKLNQGMTLVELLMAILIFAITSVGIFSIWSATMQHILDTNTTTVAAELARSDVEKAKVTGFANLPLGTYNSGTSTGTYIGTTSTSTNIAEWYDITGTFLSYQTSSGQTAPAGAKYVLVRTTTDSGVAPASGNAYTLLPTSQRTINTTVSLVSTGALVYSFGTILVQNGL